MLGVFEIDDSKKVKCPVCKQRFTPAPLHVYRDGERLICSWHCVCELRRRREATSPGNNARGKNGQPVLQLDDKGSIVQEYASASKAAVHFDIDANRIRRACRTGEKCKGFYWDYKEGKNER